MDYFFPVVIAKRFSDTDIENTKNYLQRNFFQVHSYSQRFAESHFMVAEVDLQQISQLEAAIYMNNPALRSSLMICYYFDRDGSFVTMVNQADFNIFLNTRIDQHIYVLEIPHNLSEFTIKFKDSETIFEFETYELEAEASWTEFYFEEVDDEASYLDGLDREEFNLMGNEHTHARRAG